MVVANYYFRQKNYVKSEEILRKAHENIEILLKDDNTKKYSLGCKYYVKVQISLSFMELYFQKRDFERLNNYMELAMEAWKILEDNHSSALGYAINKLNPVYLDIIKM